MEVINVVIQFFSDLEECNTEGNTLDKSYKMAFDVLGLYLEDTPESECFARINPQEIKLEKNEFVAIIEFDISSYRKRHDARTVKKILTIPS